MFLSVLIIITFTQSGKYILLKSLLLMCGITAVALLSVFILVLNFRDDSVKYSEGSFIKADAGVILGAAVWGGNRPSPVLRERIKKGYDVYAKGIASKLVITGGGSPNEMTEADVSKNELIKYGVNPDDLMLENSSSSTDEQIHFVRDKLYISRSWNKIILISDNFHLFRAKEISMFNNINADCIASDKSLTTEGTVNFCFKESLALIIFWISGI